MRPDRGASTAGPSPAPIPPNSPTPSELTPCPGIAGACRWGRLHRTVVMTRFSSMFPVQRQGALWDSHRVPREGNKSLTHHFREN